MIVKWGVFFGNRNRNGDGDGDLIYSICFEHASKLAS